MNRSQQEAGGRSLGAGPSSFWSLINHEVDAVRTPARPWSVERDEGPDKTWIRVFQEGREMPDQGWKLHVSATSLSAEDVLRRSLEVLLSSEAVFKVAEEEALETLNSGDAGLTQVGKFITVYPASDEEAVRVARALDEATRGLHGPAVPYERPLGPSSLVHYRYGTFTEQLIQDETGALVPVLRRPDGELVPDRSSDGPGWVKDPFAAAGLGAPPPSRLVGGRYAITSTLHASAVGGVYLAVDSEGRRPVALKRARKHTRTNPDGTDARDHLRQEGTVLAGLQPDERFPRPGELVEHEGDLYLPMEYIEGRQLGDYLGAYTRSARAMAGETVVAWGRSLGGALQRIHDEGLVYRDLNPSNVLIREGGGLCLVDFGFACPLGGDPANLGVGTRGFCSRQQVQGGPPLVADDVYGLGAVLFFLATGADPADAPDPFRLTSRPMRWLNPSLSEDLEEVIARCLDEKPEDRPGSMAEVTTMLEAVAGRASVTSPPLGGEVVGEPEEAFRKRCGERARRLGDTLCAIAAPRENAPMADVHVAPRDLSGGTAGLVLALAELVATFEDPEHKRVLEAAATSLQRRASDGPALPGLYVGTSGVGAALLRAGRVMDDPDLVETAAGLSARVAAAPHGGPDLYNGTAGRARFHLFVWDETHDDDHLRAAVAAGDHLLSSAERHGRKARWTAGGEALTGYAHGAAGIADVLLDLYEASGEERFAALAASAAEWIDGQRTTALADDSGFTWREMEGGPRAAPTWCRGAAGIGRFYLHAGRLEVVDGALDLALGAARTVARGGRVLDPSHCHGLSGNVEFLLDAAQAPGGAAFHNEAMMLGRLLDTWAFEMDGLLMWPSDTPGEPTPEYMTGYSGVAVCLLRLADPETRPHQLSRRGFRFMKSRAIDATVA